MRKIWKNKQGDKVHPSELSYDYLENALRYFMKQRLKIVDDKHPFWGKRRDETDRLLKLSAIIAEIKEELQKRDSNMDRIINSYGKDIY